VKRILGSIEYQRVFAPKQTYVTKKRRMEEDDDDVTLTPPPRAEEVDQVFDDCFAWI
jgi:hypothetical protein